MQQRSRVDKYRYGTVNQKHRSMLNPTSVKVYRVTGTQWKHINSFLHNGCNYNGPKEGKSVMNNIRAAELDYNVRATSTRISMK